MREGEERTERPAFRKLESEEDEEAAEDGASVEPRRKDKVELAPPAEVPSSHPKLCSPARQHSSATTPGEKRTKDETEQEPGRVVDPARRRHVGRSGEEDGNVDVLEPALGVLEVEEPERDGKDGADEEPPEDRVVDQIGRAHV